MVVVNVNVKIKNKIMKNRFIEPRIFWDWFDFGFMLKINKQNTLSDYYFAIDIQVLWFNLWIQCWEKE